MANSIRRHSGGLTDARRSQGRRHSPSDMMVIAVTAVICAAGSWGDPAEFGRAKFKWLKAFLDLPYGIPSHDTFERVFARLDPEAFDHWPRIAAAILDVSFGEDLWRARKGHAAQGFSRIRRIALNLLRRETTRKRGIKGKRLSAASDHDYLLKLLIG